MSLCINSAIAADIRGMQQWNLLRLIDQHNLLHRGIHVSSKYSHYNCLVASRSIDNLVFFATDKKDNGCRIITCCIVFNIRQKIQKNPDSTVDAICIAICLPASGEKSSSGIFFHPSSFLEIHKRMFQAFTNLRMQKAELFLGDSGIHRYFSEQLCADIVINLKIL